MPLAPLPVPTATNARPLPSISISCGWPQTRYPLPEELRGLPLVSLVNAGAIENSIPAGPVTLGKLLGALPYSIDGWVAGKCCCC